MALPQKSYQNSSPIKRMENTDGPPWAVCPVCGRALGPFDRTVWEMYGWRRGRCAGCDACFAPREGEEVLFYEVWEAPEMWFLED